MQWVLENCLPCGTIQKPDLQDIRYVKELLGVIERDQIAAASPIEQRWTARSSSPLSPAYSEEADALFSWVGVIMYITSESQAPAIKAKFKEYAERHVDLTFKYEPQQQGLDVRTKKNVVGKAVERRFWKESEVLHGAQDGFFHWGKVDLSFHEGARRTALSRQLARKPLGG